MNLTSSFITLLPSEQTKSNQFIQRWLTRGALKVKRNKGVRHLASKCRTNFVWSGLLLRGLIVKE